MIALKISRISSPKSYGLNYLNIKRSLVVFIFTVTIEVGTSKYRVKIHVITLDLMRNRNE